MTANLGFIFLWEWWLPDHNSTSMPCVSTSLFGFSHNVYQLLSLELCLCPSHFYGLQNKDDNTILHCYHQLRPCSKLHWGCLLCTFLCPASPAFFHTPICRWLNQQISQMCLFVEQEIFCWLILVWFVVTWREKPRGLLTPPWCCLGFTCIILLKSSKIF